MRVLVLGASGMIGHRMWATLSLCGHEVFGAIRTPILDKLALIPGISKEKAFVGIDVFELASIEEAIKKSRPDIVLNCIGIVKQLPISRDPVTSIHINALFPHQLAEICSRYKCRMIHFSSDCVFSGIKGQYKEGDFPDDSDIYGRSKALGEVVDQDHVLTIRTSTIGREVKPHGGLVEWFISNREKKVKGFSKAIYSGFPAHTLAKYIDKYILNKNISGLYHLSTEPINKYDLLTKANDLFHLSIEIEKEDKTLIERSLDSSLFREKFGAPELKWSEILEDILIDNEIYEQLRKNDE